MTRRFPLTLTRVLLIIAPALLTGVAAIRSAAAQTREPFRAPPASRSFGATLRDDLRGLASTRTLGLLAVGGALSAATLRVEDPVQQATWFDVQQFDGGIDVSNTYGDAATLGAGAALAMVVGHVTHDAALRGLGFDAARSLVYSGAAVWALKTTVRRTRPNGGAYSFPSGHTAAAFSVAPAIRRHLGWRYALPAYALAGGAAIGRMEDNVHFASDVLFGAAIGTAVGEAVAGSAPAGSIAQHVWVGPRGIGVRFNF